MRKMYKVLVFAATCLMTAGVVSCEEEKKDGPITVKPSSLQFKAAGETKTITVEGLNWQATESADWIELDQTGGTITVTVDRNEGEERSASITVKNSEDTKTVTVTQDAVDDPVVDPALGLDTEELEFGRAGGNKAVLVTSELDWTATTDDAWITIDESDNSFTVTVGENTADSRTGTITVSNGEEEKSVTVLQAGVADIVFTNGNMGFYWDMNDVGTSNFEIEFMDAENYNSAQNYINLDINTPLIPDLMDAYLPDGTYNFMTEEDYSEFTFTGKAEGGRPEVKYTDGDGTQHMAGIVSGEFTSSSEGMNYTIEFNLVLSDGVLLKASFAGVLSAWPLLGRDVTVDLNDYDDFVTKIATFTGDFDAKLWQIYIGKNASDYGVYLAYSGEENTIYPPTGHFPMANKALLCVPGTAEPTSMVDGLKDLGCLYTIDGRMFAVPGKGFIDIELIGSSTYEISFELEGHDGHTVTGSYSGYIEGGDPGSIEGEQEFISATAIYWGDSDKGSDEYQLTFYDNLGGRLEIYYLYSELVSEPDLSDGTYVYTNPSTSAPFTFKNFYYIEANNENDYEGRGSFTILQDGDDYIIDFSNIQFDGGYTLEATTYRGPITYE